jgi:hypothetical protein
MPVFSPHGTLTIGYTSMLKSPVGPESTLDVYNFGPEPRSSWGRKIFYGSYKILTVIRSYLGKFKSAWANFFHSILEIKANNFVDTFRNMVL